MRPLTRPRLLLRARGGRYAESAAAASIKFTGIVFTGGSNILTPLVLVATRSRRPLRDREHRGIYIPNLCSTPLYGRACKNFTMHRLTGKTRMIRLGYHMLKKVWWCIEPFRMWQTDGRTDEQNCYINVLTRNRNGIQLEVNFVMTVGYCMLAYRIEI